MKIKFTRDNDYFQKGVVLERVTNIDYEIISESTIKTTIWYIKPVSSANHIYFLSDPLKIKSTVETYITLYSGVDFPNDFWFEILDDIEDDKKEINMKEIIVEEKQPVVTYQKLREKNACEKGLLKVMDRFGEELFSGVDYSAMHKYVSTNMSTSDFDWLVKNFSLKEKDKKCVLLDDFFKKGRTDKGILVLYKNDCFYFMYEFNSNVYSLVRYNNYSLLYSTWGFYDIKNALSDTKCKLYWFSSMKDAVDFIEKNKE